MELRINRNQVGGMPGIEALIAEGIKAELGVEKVSVFCKTHNWQGHTCPEFSAIADGVKLLVFGSIDAYELSIDPWSYSMKIDYVLK